jgi:hypothetical protein
MAASHHRSGTRILGHLHKKETRGPLIRDSPSTIRGVVHQIMVVVTAEVQTHSDLCTACITRARLIIAPKTAPYSLSPREKWTRDPTSLCHKQHPEKSTTPCNGLPHTNNTAHPTLHLFHNKPTKTTKPKLWLIMNHTTTPRLAICNLRQLHK